MHNQNGDMHSSANSVAPPFPGSVLYLQPPPTAAGSQVDSYRHKQSVGLGAAQLALGCLCVVFNCVSLGLTIYYGISFVGHGIWCGVLFIITGAFGISAGMNKTKCKILAYMVLCIISACFTVALLVGGIVGAFFSVFSGAYGCDNGYSSYDQYYYRPTCRDYRMDAVLEGCIAVCGFIAAILFIWASTLACKSKICTCCTCCQPQQDEQPIAHIHSAPTNFQQLQTTGYPLTTMPCQQGMVVVTTPPPYQPNNVVPMMNAATATGGAEATGVAQVQYDDPQPDKC